MNRLAWAVLLAACTPDSDLYPVQPASSGPVISKVVEGPDAAIEDGGIGDGGIDDGGIDGGPSGPGIPITDGGMFSQDAGGRPADAAIPP